MQPPRSRLVRRCLGTWEHPLTRGGQLGRPTNRGWVVTLAGFGINLTLGVLYSWSIFAKELSAEWGWSTGGASVPYAVAVAFFALVLTFAGRAQDRYGPRLVASLGGALVGLGLLLSSMATPQNHVPLILGFGVMTGSGIAMGFVSTFPAAAKWFPPRRRGLITGLVVSGFGIASVYIAPLTQLLLGQWGIKLTFLLLGAGFLVVTTVLAQLLQNPPSGYLVEGATVADLSETPAGCPPAQREYDWHEMVRTRPFVLLWLMYGLTAFAGIMIIGHMAKITITQTGLDLGFVLVAILAVGNASGRIIAGIVTDRIGAVRTMTIVFTSQALVMVLIGFADSALLLAPAAFI
ncbi:MAG TPA: MFS transporter, partial [Coriobacteriia bacterium]|nr:MFS transporter [Coriobacteriia bacterium]